MTNLHTLLAQHLLTQRSATSPASELADVKPQSIDDAFAVQQQMIALLNQDIAGWKCLTPLENGQLIFAPILRRAVVEQFHCPIIPFAKSSGLQALIEPEIAFVLGQDFAAYQSYNHQQIDLAISATHMALELIQSRFSADYTASYVEKLADGLSNQGLYLGPQIDKALAYQANNINITVSHDGEARTFDGAHPCQSPQAPIYWLINYLTSKGVNLKKGQAIITGSYCGVVKVPMAAQIDIEYQGLGKVSVQFEQQTLKA
ncbi:MULTISPECIES: fumarylacetoacetate hydrolase family protein [Pseudomonadati]|uniref:Fumarylacetoacetase-like C-terminal domain-containing protein n=1 Tax=Shewanella aestuarii TaxID=1028752 RepID=A0ABT0L530_9GAMM|nr:fumarylacetoacetate hydrolase family protein [Shewanella aestuarii]MCL1118814.1 hypothetical protein [Shewanella aestuarii]GGN83625.1 hydratase [Shewanella aestuarii]